LKEGKKKAKEQEERRRDVRRLGLVDRRVGREGWEGGGAVLLLIGLNGWVVRDTEGVGCRE
jgi:hypothetical protein